jgi:hypothetical protein
MLRWTLIIVGTLVGLLVLLLVIIPVAARPWYQDWGATSAETKAALPGDELVPHPKGVSTRAVTIDAPPEAVWPWIVQVGMKRAGWYTYDWFYDMTGSSGFVDGHSSDRIVPALQDIKVGDTVSINSAVGYKVAVMDQPDAFILLSRGGAKPSDTYELGHEPPEYMNTTMGWVLRPLSGNKTRLILRILADGAGTAHTITNSPPLEMGGGVMSRANLLGIKHRAEAAYRAGTAKK